jgi:ABC-2 type transport system permease protein
MRHYPRLFATYFRLGMLNELQYRSNFWINLFQSLLGMGTALGALAVVFHHTDTLGGWLPAELLALVGIYFLMRGAIRTVIQPSMEAFLASVREGTLDFILVKPEESQVLVSIQRISIWSLFDVLLGIGAIGYALYLLEYAMTWTDLAAFLLVMLTGVLIVYSFWFILATFAFWFIRVENILVIFSSLYEAGRWPVTIYPAALRIILTFLVPVAFAVTVPAEALTGRITLPTLGLSLLVAALLVGFSRWFWTFGVRHYSGASA